MSNETTIRALLATATAHLTNGGQILTLVDALATATASVLIGAGEHEPELRQVFDQMLKLRLEEIRAAQRNGQLPSQ